MELNILNQLEEVKKTLDQQIESITQIRNIVIDKINIVIDKYKLDVNKKPCTDNKLVDQTYWDEFDKSLTEGNSKNGEKFEKLCFCYFKNKLDLEYIYTKNDMPKHIQKRLKLEGKRNRPFDIVFKEKKGKLTIVECKQSKGNRSDKLLAPQSNLGKFIEYVKKDIKKMRVEKMIMTNLPNHGLNLPFDYKIFLRGHFKLTKKIMGDYQKSVQETVSKSSKKIKKKVVNNKREKHSFAEARRICIKHNVKTGEEYRKVFRVKYNRTSQKILPSEPNRDYKEQGWIDWYHFLEKPRPLSKQHSQYM